MPAHPSGEVTLWQVRFPRVVLAIVVGAALGCAGALLQGVFANPLAEPGVIGVSSGAAVGASARHRARRRVRRRHLAVAAARVRRRAWSRPPLVYLLARSEGRTEVVTLVLTGVAINAFAGGLIAFLTFVANPPPATRSCSGSSAASTAPPGARSRSSRRWRVVGIAARMTIASEAGPARARRTRRAPPRRRRRAAASVRDRARRAPGRGGGGVHRHHPVRRPGRAAPDADDRRPGAPHPDPRQRAGGAIVLLARRPRRAHPGAQRRPAAGHADRARSVARSSSGCCGAPAHRRGVGHDRARRRIRDPLARDSRPRPRPRPARSACARVGVSVDRGRRRVLETVSLDVARR